MKRGSQYSMRQIPRQRARSGFTMGNEFNNVSKSSVLCGTEFHDFPPYQDGPEDVTEEREELLNDISGYFLGGIAAFSSVLRGDVEGALNVLYIFGGNAIRSRVDKQSKEAAKLLVVMAGGAFYAKEKKEQEIKRIGDMLVAAIPQKVTNKTVVATLDKLSGIFCMSESDISMNYLYNLKTMTYGNSVPYNPEEYIENQDEWNKVKFGGWFKMSFSGCEIIATYNALKALQEEVSAQTMASLISMYERDGAVLGGLFGTSPIKIKEYFEERNYSVMMSYSKDSNVINEIGEKSDTVIVTAYNNKNDIMGQIHTVSITKDEVGKYAVHNAYCQDKKGVYVAKEGYSTLQDAIDAISKKNPSSICVIGISNPETDGDNGKDE